MVQRRDGVCTSINFNFCAWYEVEIRFGDNPRQKETINDIIWFRRRKCVIYRLDIILSITRVAQLMVSKSISSVRGIFVDIRRGISVEGYQTCKEAKKWQLLIVSMWHLIDISGYIAVYAYGNASNFKLRKIEEILSDLVRKHVVEFSDKFSHFQYATQAMFKGALSNYSMIKLLFFLINTHFCNCKNVSHRYYATNQDTKPRIFYCRIAPKYR